MTRILLACGIAAGPWFLGVALVQGLTREPFDFSRNAISQLSLGELGWIQVTSFVITACLAIAASIGLCRALTGGPGGTWAPRLVAVFGVSFLVSAFFSADPGAGFPDAADQAALLSTTGAIHMAGAMVGFLSLCAAFVVMGRHFAARGERGWAIACRLVPVGVLAGFAGSSATVMAFTAGAGLGLIWLAVVSARVRATVSA
ncbi:DUF998 domain-containing protein [Nonomuraea typhae]|uniref:DUF998 domain-containing protein n=1 Tax=Nonomuraea typhae TaxID=2603600 RepID=UPI0012FA9F16|nr:DUF998 domain-containing protein [Nonomuraea typhae]